MKPLDPRLLRHATATRAHLAVLVVLGAAAAAATIGTATLLAGGIDTVVAGHGGLRGTLAGLAALVAVRAVLAWLAEASGHRAAAAVKSQLRHRMLAAAVEHRDHPHRTAHLTTLATTGIDALDDYFAKYLPQLVLALLVPAAVVATIAPADPVAGITILATLPLIPIFMILIGLATNAATRSRWQALTRLSSHFLDVVTGLTTLAIFGRTGHQATTIARITDTYRRTTMATLRIALLSALVLDFLATLSVALVAVGVGLRLVDGHLDLRTALLVLILAPEAYLPLRAVGAHYHASADGLAAAEEIFTVLDNPRPPAGTAVPPAAVTDILLDAVTVTHPDRPVPTPPPTSLLLRCGQLVALTGASGTGKTTLLSVLLGFTAPTAGQVRVNGHDLAGLDPDAWRTRISYLAQQPYLFAGTVADNIRLGRPEAPAGLVVAAARDACLDVNLDRRVGEAGTGLSAGQARRVGLARALLRDTPVLLLDEPTAGLDPDTETRVLHRLRALADAGRTVLVASHRPATARYADHVLALDAVPV